MTETIRSLILDLLPQDASIVGNQSLLAALQAAQGDIGARSTERPIGR